MNESFESLEQEKDDLEREMRRNGLTRDKLDRLYVVRADYWAEMNAAGYWEGQ